METIDGSVLQVGPTFQQLVLRQHLILPFGTVGELLQHLSHADERHLYLLIGGIRGNLEGITLEAYLRTAQTTIFLAAEGLYGLRKASQQGVGLSASVDITQPLEELRHMSLMPQTACTLQLQPRFPLHGNEILNIEQVALFVDAA